MTGLAFLGGIVVLFIGLLAYESEDGGARLRDSQRGLWTRLISDNGPAKVGGVLLVIGLGALLRVSEQAPWRGIVTLIGSALGPWSTLSRQHRGCSRAVVARRVSLAIAVLLPRNATPLRPLTNSRM